MDQYPIQGILEILQVVSCYGNRVKPSPDRPLGSNADLTINFKNGKLTNVWCRPNLRVNNNDGDGDDDDDDDRYNIALKFRISNGAFQ